MKRLTLPVAVLSLAALTACGGNHGGADQSKAAQAHGPIKIWYSNNPEEVAWGEQAVAAWNAAHPSEQVSGQEIPAGKSSEEVISAAVTAGTEPCLIFNTSPASVPGLQAQGGLVPLDDFPDGKSYVEARTGAKSAQYRSPDGKYYQMPWKSNPVMIFYNKKLFKKAGIDVDKPPLATDAQFLETARKLVSSKAAKYAINPAPSSEFFQSWFDFYPMYAAESGGKSLVENKKATFDGPAGQSVAQFWHSIYAGGLAGKEAYKGDAFADGVAAMATVGPWAISVYKGKVDWGVVPVPTSQGTPASSIHTFSDAKNIGMFVSCKNRGTAWDFTKFVTGSDQDGKLLQTTGQMPMRTGLPQAYADYFAKNPAYKQFADQADRTVEVPSVPNSVAAWQAFRDSWTKSVVFGGADPNQALHQVAGKIDGLVEHG
ncbi:extracellular solute-binding protein [Actinomadura sp. DC4]|uniref:extracellular solute-binding protein n=1 Tax=Actinomadura sp. DC4 TaxID=3055069 RepID=UPI0025B1AD07|nr:extracellular solute-binding protein [Actinomadura sp. DC4]MDN3351585.1 extracellular solute-binding protein [Actinomadura sp. DC4]